MNRRFIRIAKNNQKTTDQVFRQQLIVTVAGVIRLYDDLVSLGEDVKVKEETLALAERLYQGQQGSGRPGHARACGIDTCASRGGLCPAGLGQLAWQFAAAGAHPEDCAHAPRDSRPHHPRRPSTTHDTHRSASRGARTSGAPIWSRRRCTAGRRMEEARLQIENSHIALEGSRNQLLPDLNLVATGQNSALAGQPQHSLRQFRNSTRSAAGQLDRRTGQRSFRKL